MTISRREFLGAAAATAFVSSRVLGANEKLGVGLIGCGGQGTHHLHKLVKNPELKVLAVCDIYKPRLENAKAVSGAPGYHHYKDLLARPDIDCVWIATPDHWHSRMSIEAMEAGKDVYCEKPMARYWHEARDFYATAQRTKRVVQIGSQDTSRPIWRLAREHVQAGKLGKLVWSQTSIARNIRDGDWKYGVNLNAGTHNLDWKAFLGPAADRPYDPERFFRWRKYWDYSGGIATDLFVHVLHSLCIPLGNEWPTRVVSAGGVFLHMDRETPDTFHALIDYEGGHTVFMAGTQANEQGLPVVIRGHEATMYLSGSDVEIRPERIYSAGREEEKFRAGDVGNAINEHHRNFLDCVRRRDPNTNCNALLGYKVDVAVDMSIECWRKNKVLTFDAEKQEVLGRVNAVRLARRAMGTTFEVVLGDGDESIAEEALALVDRLEDQLSLYLPTSEISAINAAPGPVRVEPRLYRLLERMRSLHARTNKAFDGGIGRARLGRQTDRWVHANDLDLGGIGKGYAIDRVVELLKARGVTEAFVHGGTSTVYAMGEWKVGLVDPREPDERIGSLTLRDQALSTSSNLGGKPGHIPGGEHVCAWALCDNATDADALSTALLIAGPGMEGLGVRALVLDADGELHVRDMQPELYGNGVSRRMFMRGTAAVVTLGMLPRRARAQDPKELKRVLNVAVVGTGEQGRMLLTQLKRMPAIKVPAVCDVSDAALKKAVAIAGRKVETYESAEHLLDEEVLDAVIVATPTHLHKDACVRALEAGVHVFCEAPLAGSIEDCKAIARAAKKAKDVVFQAGHQRRCSPLYPYVLTHVKSGAIGNLALVRAQWNRKVSWRRPGKGANWRLNKQTSGGLLLEQGSHVFDLAHWYFGALPESVMGMGSLLKWKDGRDVDDAVQAMLRFPGGRQLHFGASLINSYGDETEVLVGDSAGVFVQRQAKALLFKEADTALVGWEEYAAKEMRDGRRGIILDAMATKYKDKEEAKQLGPDAGKADYHAELEQFFAAVRKGEKPKCGAVQGMQAAVVGIVANEAVSKGTLLKFTKEHFEV